MPIYYADGHSDLRDSLAPPVEEPRWEQSDVSGRVNRGAVSIAIWARYGPSAYAWVASPTFEVVDDAKVPTPRYYRRLNSSASRGPRQGRSRGKLER